MTKICVGGCGLEKPLEDFALAPRMKDGRHSYCRECQATYTKERRARETQAERDARNARRRARHNPEAARQRRAENYERINEMERKSRLKQKYGITLEQYEAMAAEQNDLCAICGRNEPLRVDHDHETGEVRALLCHGCNVTLGLMQEDPDRLLAAAAYLLGQRLKDTLDLG